MSEGTRRVLFMDEIEPELEDEELLDGEEWFDEHQRHLARATPEAAWAAFQEPPTGASHAALPSQPQARTTRTEGARDESVQQ